MEKRIEHKKREKKIPPKFFLMFSVLQTPHWPVIKQAARTIGLSAIEAARILGDRLPCEATIESEDTDTVSAMASLCVANTGQSDTENL